MPSAVDYLFGFQGGQYDQESGLLKMGARFYNTQTGQFLSQDPSGFAAGDSNLRRFVRNDPVNATDPSGLFTRSVLGGASNGTFNSSWLNQLTAAQPAEDFGSFGLPSNVDFQSLISQSASAGASGFGGFGGFGGGSTSSIASLMSSLGIPFSSPSTQQTLQSVLSTPPEVANPFSGGGGASGLSTIPSLASSMVPPTTPEEAAAILNAQPSVTSVQIVGSGTGLGTQVFGEAPLWAPGTGLGRVALDTIAPAVQQSYRLTYDNGSQEYVLGGFPSGAAMLGQAAIFAPYLPIKGGAGAAATVAGEEAAASRIAAERTLAPSGIGRLTGFSGSEAQMVGSAERSLQGAGYNTSQFRELIRADMPSGYRGMSLDQGAALGKEAFSSQEMLNHVLEEELIHLQQKAAGLGQSFGPGTAQGLEEAANAARQFPKPQ